MSDLIDRRAAIDAVQHAFDRETLLNSFVRKVAVDALKTLPSAQPERLTDDDFETIRIHLNAYKEKLCNLGRWKEAKAYERLIDRFIAFATAQPEEDCDTCKHGYFGDDQCNNCRVRYPSHYERRTDD